MATFRIGQRVRFVGPWEGTTPRPQNEGVVSGVGAEGATTQYVYDWYVLMDDGRDIVADSGELEPILYDGNKTAKWSECLWQPNHVREAEHLRQQLELKEVV